VPGFYFVKKNGAVCCMRKFVWHENTRVWLNVWYLMARILSKTLCTRTDVFFSVGYIKTIYLPAMKAWILMITEVNFFFQALKLLRCYFNMNRFAAFACEKGGCE